MSDTIKELLDVPRDFLRDGTQLLNRCTKPDRREFIRISQAVGVGFVVMGAIGYFVKLSKFYPSPFLFFLRTLSREGLLEWFGGSLDLLEMEWLCLMMTGAWGCAMM